MKFLLKICVSVTVVLNISCYKGNDQYSDYEGSLDSNFVSYDQANRIADLIQPFYRSVKNKSHVRSGSSFNAESSNIIPILDKNGNTNYYVINFSRGGFILLSASKRSNPILAFSDHDTFPLNQVKYIDALEIWMDDMHQYVGECRSREVIPSQALNKLWDDIEILNYITGSYEHTEQMSKKDSFRADTSGVPWVRNCPTQISVTGPLDIPKWGQGSGYNDALRPMGCVWDIHGRPFTGCVATAMSQIMRYHRFPGGYNWNLMPLNAPSPETARLMRDAGQSVKMNWGCSGSSAYMNEVPRSFKTNFKYSSADRSTNNGTLIQTIISEIASRRPVILSGVRIAAGNNRIGHAWVCSGTRRTFHFNQDNCHLYLTTTALFMDWGWDEQFNGWYFHWNPGNSDYSQDRNVVFNIKP